MPRFDYHFLSPADQEERIRASRAKADMDRLGLSLSEAAARNGVRPWAVVFWFYGSIRLERDGRRRVTPDDEVFRMVVVTTEGVLELDVRGSRERSLVGAHTSAIYRLLVKGDPRPLLAMQGTVVASHELETDPREIEGWAFVGELDFLEIYLTDASDDEVDFGS